MGMACLEAAGINGELDGDCEDLRLDLGFRGWGKQRGSRGDKAEREREQRHVEGVSCPAGSRWRGVSADRAAWRVRHGYREGEEEERDWQQGPHARF